MEVAIVGETYEPSHDSYLLASSVRCGEYCTVVDLGSGSGYITVVLAKCKYHVIALDISPCAVLSTHITSKVNGVDVYVDVIQSDGIRCLRPCRCFKVIFCNPPYLPVNESSTWIGISWSGGLEGIEVFLNMIEGVENIMSADGELIFVHSTLANLDKLLRELASRGFEVEELQRQCFFWECIVLFRARRGRR